MGETQTTGKAPLAFAMGFGSFIAILAKEYVYDLLFSQINAVLEAPIGALAAKIIEVVGSLSATAITAVAGALLMLAINAWHQRRLHEGADLRSRDLLEPSIDETHGRVDAEESTGFESEKSPPLASAADAEHEDKKAAKFALRSSMESHFEPSYQALIKFRVRVTECFGYTLPQGVVRNAAMMGFREHCVRARRDGELTWNQIRSADTIRASTLHQVETTYYHAFVEYSLNVELAFAMLDFPKFTHAVGNVDAVKALHDKWRPLHDAMISHHVELKEKNPDLTTVPHMHRQNGFNVPEVDWDRLRALVGQAAEKSG